MEALEFVRRTKEELGRGNRRCCINERGINLLSELTSLLKGGELPLTPEVVKEMKRLTTFLLRKQKSRNRYVKHDGFWQVENFQGGFLEEFLGIVRVPTAYVLSFLTTAYFKVPRFSKWRKLKEAILQGIAFEGILYVSYQGDIGTEPLFWGNRLMEMMEPMFGGMVAKFAALYREDERVLPILAAFVKIYREAKRELAFYHFIREGGIPEEFSFLKNSTARREIEEFFERIFSELGRGIYDEERILDKFYPDVRRYKMGEWERRVKDLEEQWGEVFFYPQFFQEPQFKLDI